MMDYKTFGKKYKHFTILITFVFLILWFEYLKKTIIPKYIIYCGLDSYIPFIKEFIIAYYAWFIYMAFGLVYLGIVAKNDFYRLFMLLVLNMSVAYILYIIFPNGQFARPIVGGNDIFSNMVKFIYSIDETNNVCPSLHVANAIAVQTALINCDKLKSKYLLKKVSFMVMILISASTVFVKQHSIIDVFAGVILALIIYSCVYKMPKIFTEIHDLNEEGSNA